MWSFFLCHLQVWFFSRNFFFYTHIYNVSNLWLAGAENKVNTETQRLSENPSIIENKVEIKTETVAETDTTSKTQTEVEA